MKLIIIFILFSLTIAQPNKTCRMLVLKGGGDHGAW